VFFFFFNFKGKIYLAQPFQAIKLGD